MTELDVYTPPFEQLNQQRLSELEALCLAPTGPNDRPAIGAALDFSLQSAVEGKSNGVRLNRNEAIRIAVSATDPNKSGWAFLSELYECSDPEELAPLLYTDMVGWAVMRDQAHYYPNRTDDDCFELDRRYLKDVLLGEPLHPGASDGGSYIKHIVGSYNYERFESVANRCDTGMKREVQLIGAALLTNPHRDYGRLAGLRTELGISDREMQTVFTLAIALSSYRSNKLGFYDLALSDEKLQRSILESDKPELQQLSDGNLVTEYSLAAFSTLVEKGNRWSTENCSWDRLVEYYGAEGMELILPTDVRAEIVADTYAKQVEKVGRIVEPHFHTDVLQVLDVETVAKLADAELDAMIANPWAHLEDKWPSEFELSFFASKVEQKHGLDLDLENLCLHDIFIRSQLDTLRKFASPGSALDEKGALLTARADTYDIDLLTHIKAYCTIAANRCFEYADPVYGKRVSYYEEDRAWIDEEIAKSKQLQVELDAIVEQIKQRLQELSAQS